MKTVTFTPVLETSILADNDVFFIPIQVAGVFKNGEAAKLIYIQVVDKDDQGTDFSLFFYDASATLGTLNSAVTINDTDAAKALGHVELTAAANGVDNVNSWLFTKFLDEGIVMQPVDGSSSLYVGGVVRSGTPTYTASGFEITLGFE